MLTYTFKRIIQGIVTIWFIATATFFAMHAVPGDPLANERATTPAIRKNLEARYGLDRPVTEQYLVFLALGEAGHQLLNCLRLVACRFEIRDDLEWRGGFRRCCR